MMVYNIRKSGIPESFENIIPHSNHQYTQQPLRMLQYFIAE